MTFFHGLGMFLLGMFLILLASVIILFIINYLINSGLTARGDTKTYRNFLIIGFLLNIGLDPLLLFGVRLGDATIIPPLYEAGIALATILIQFVPLPDRNTPHFHIMLLRTGEVLKR